VREDRQCRLIACIHAAIATSRFARLKLWAEAREAVDRGKQYIKLLSAMETLLDDYSLKIFRQLRDWFDDANTLIDKQEITPAWTFEPLT